MVDGLIGRRRQARFAVSAVPMAAVAALALTDASADPALVPCDAMGGGKYECSWWRSGDGRTGGSIVVSDGKVVGYLHQGRNWITCQQAGAAVYNEAGDRNRWYGWTQSDSGGRGWASALDAKGGDDYGKFAGVPGCDNKHGPAPGVGGLWGTQPPGGAQPPSSAPPQSRPGEDTSCSQTRDSLRAIARFTAHVYGAYQASRRGERVRLRRLKGLDSHFKIGSVEIRTAGCKRDGRWRPLGEPHVKVSSAGLDKDSKPRFTKDKQNFGYGWGVVVEGYRDDNARLTIRIVRCAPNWAAQARAWNQLLGLGSSLAKLPHPVSAGIAIGTYLADKLTPPDGTDCITLNEHGFKVRATANRLRISHTGARGGSVAARFGPETGGNGTSIREVLMAEIQSSPRPRREPPRRPGVQP
jgi:hypothetical protein